LIVGGLALTAYGLVPARSARQRDAAAANLRVQRLDEAPLRLAHVLLLLVMAAEVTIDVMKPTTLAFVVPGRAEEYGLKSALHPDGVVGIAPPSLRGAALLGALPVALAALAVGRFGIETRRRGLEEITAVELPKALEAR
jgi:hypothetical protein